MGLGLITGFTFGHLIAFGLAIWCTVETENQNTIQATLALKLLLAYDLAMVMCFIGAILWIICSSRNKHDKIISLDTQSTGSSLDLEEK